MLAGILDLSDQPFARAATAIGLVVAAWALGRLLRHILRGPLTKRRTKSFGIVVPKLLAWGIVTVAVIGAITMVFPSVKPVDVIGGLGIFSIALGFAFQDILSNLLAGLLLIIRQPFASGDQIDVNGFTGTVEGITIRETTMRTFDGERVVIPNKDVYQSAVTVKTAYDARRTSLGIGVGYDDDLEHAEAVILDAVRSVEGVHDDPAPQAYLTELNSSSVDFDVRYWTDPDIATVRATEHAVFHATKAALDEAGIDIPFPIRTLELGATLDDALSSAD